MKQNKEKKLIDRINLALVAVPLLLEVGLDAALQRLALVVHIPPLGLALAVARDGGTDATERTLCAVGDTLTQIRELALGFLRLAVGILLGTGLAEVLVAKQAPEGLLGRADSLVPRTAGAVLVVFGGSTGVGVGSEWANFGGGVGSIVLLLGLRLGAVGLVLLCHFTSARWFCRR
jgi:hypothetical protein